MTSERHLTDEPDEPDDEADHTFVVDRSAGGDAGGEEEAGEDEADHTFVVDRVASAEVGEDEHTVVVRGKPKAEANAGAEAGEDEHTVVVRGKRKAAARDDAESSANPEVDETEHTVVVKRARKAAADDDGEDHTVVVGRKPGKASLARTPASKRRRGIALPPVPEGFGPRAIDAIGPNAEVTVAPRAIPDLPAAPAQVIEGPAATRAAAPFMPSVLRRGQRTARTAVIAFAAVCVVSVVGLTLIALAVF